MSGGTPPPSDSMAANAAVGNAPTTNAIKTARVSVICKSSFCCEWSKIGFSPSTQGLSQSDEVCSKEKQAGRFNEMDVHRTKTSRSSVVSARKSCLTSGQAVMRMYKLYSGGEHVVP